MSELDNHKEKGADVEAPWLACNSWRRTETSEWNSPSLRPCDSSAHGKCVQLICARQVEVAEAWGVLLLRTQQNFIRIMCKGTKSSIEIGSLSICTANTECDQLNAWDVKDYKVSPQIVGKISHTHTHTKIVKTRALLSCGCYGGVAMRLRMTSREPCLISFSSQVRDNWSQYKCFSKSCLAYATVAGINKRIFLESLTVWPHMRLCFFVDLTWHVKL